MSLGPLTLNAGYEQGRHLVIAAAIYAICIVRKEAWKGKIKGNGNGKQANGTSRTRLYLHIYNI